MSELSQSASAENPVRTSESVTRRFHGVIYCEAAMPAIK